MDKITRIHRAISLVLTTFIFLFGKVYCAVDVTIQSPDNVTYYTNQINLTYTVTGDNDSSADIYIYLDGALIDQKSAVALPYTNTTILEINKEGQHNITVYAVGAQTSAEDSESRFPVLDLYDESVTYSNYSIYDSSKYVDTLKYTISVRCGALNHNITINAWNNKTYTITCDNETKTIEDSYRFVSEGINNVWFYLNAVDSGDSRYFGNESFVADLYPPIVVTDYAVVVGDLLSVGIVSSDTISPVTICTAKLNDITIIENKTLASGMPFVWTTSLLPLLNRYNILRIRCEDVVKHVTYLDRIVSVTPNFIKTLEWDFPQKYYVDEKAKVTGTFTIVNVGDIPIINPISESIPFVYGEDLIIRIKETDEEVLRADVWNGPISIEIKNIPPGEKRTYIIEYEMPTVKTISKREYFIIEGGKKYNVLQLVVRSEAPITLGKVYYKTDVEDCSVVDKAFVDNLETKVSCSNNILSVYLGSFTPSEQKVVRILMKGAPVAPKRPGIELPEAIQDAIEYISNAIGSVGDFIQDFINRITEFFSGLTVPNIEW